MQLIVQIYTCNEKDDDTEVDIVRPFDIKDDDNAVLRFMQDVLNYTTKLEQEYRKEQ